MLAHPRGPTPLRRRSDTYKSTGLDYSTCCRVEEDIPSRIRSLLLSRHAYYPPRTPCPSDGAFSGRQADHDVVDGFDFKTAKSVATSRLGFDRFSLTSKQVLGSPYPPEVLPTSRLSKRSAFRSSNSTNDLCAPNICINAIDANEAGEVLEGAMTHKNILTCCPPYSPDGGNRPLLGFRDLAPEPEIRSSDEYDIRETSPFIIGSNLEAKDSIGQAPRTEGLFAPPGPSIRTNLSNSSLRFKDRTPSLETTASRGSAHQLAPLLVSAPSALPISDNSETDKNATSPQSRVPIIREKKLDISTKTGKPGVCKPNHISIASGMVEAVALNPVIPPVYFTASSTIERSDHAPSAQSGFDLEPLAEVARTANEYLERMSSGNDDSVKNGATGGTEVRECIGETPPATSVGQEQPITPLTQVDSVPRSADNLKTFSNVAPTNGGSYENLTPQESLDFQGVPMGLEDKDVGSKNFKWKHSPGNSCTKYSTIPTRKSSLDRTSPGSRKTSKSLYSGKQNFDQLLAKAGRKVQPTSKGSSNSSSPDSRFSGLVEEGVALPGNFDSRLALHWLRDLFPDQEPYGTRLTAIPQRQHRLSTIPSKSAPPIKTPHDVASTPKTTGKHLEPRISEIFTRTITDLENLMNEALLIARQAAEREDARMPDLLEDARAVLQSGIDVPAEEGKGQRAYERDVIRVALRSEFLDNVTSRVRIRESSSAVSDTSSQRSDVSTDIYHEPHHQRLREDIRQADFNGVIVPHTSLTWPLNRASTPHTSPIFAGPASVATGLQRKNTEVKHPEHDGSAVFISTATVRASKSSAATQLLDIRSGNAERNRHGNHSKPSQHKKNESQGSEHVAKEAPVIREPYKEDPPDKIKVRRPSKAILNKREVTEFIRVFHEPPIQSRYSSLALRNTANAEYQPAAVTSSVDHAPIKRDMDVSSLKSSQSQSVRTLSTSQGSVSEVDFSTPQGLRKRTSLANAGTSSQVYKPRASNEGEENLPKRHISGRRLHDKIQHLKQDKFAHLNLRGKSHISLRDHRGFSLSKSHRRQPIARDWSPGRKRFVASVACISTALIGILIGIYAGEVPSIQYYIADFNHYAILGNVFFLIGLALSTFFFWPLPLLHGRKPYILSALTIAMPLLFPQAISVSMQRSPYVSTWRVGLILPRTFMGVALGFANINFMATLTDLFGASLQSGNPHQETVDDYDVRRHGSGLGVWLGIWTWCYVGTIGVGFLIGALIINSLSPDWGFYVSIVIIAVVLLLNVVTPEVRRSAFRRSLAEVRNGSDISRRLARGEVMMHRLQTGPKWWGEEFHQGVLLSLDMMRQPGFLVMSLYVAWMYGQVVLVIVLLGSLMSKYYRFTSPAVGFTTLAIPLAALLAVPFQKASLFSRARHHAQRTDSGTLNRKITLSSHIVRRAIFTLVLPFAGLGYTLTSGGPPTPFILPVLFAGLIGFLSNLAIAECNGIIMETFDTSDLQPGMTGRPRGASGERTKYKRTNYSSFPRVSSAFAIIQALGFLIGSAATGVGGVAERHLGQMSATGVMAGILLILTIGVLGVLVRFKEVQIVPAHREEDMEKWERERQISVQRSVGVVARATSAQAPPEVEESWRPVIIGNPSGRTRRMSILELGHLSRWSEIRRKNRLVDEMSYEARHPNLATLEDVRKEIREKNLGALGNLGGLHRGGGGSRRSKRSQLSQGSEEPEPDDTGGLGERKLSD